ncbi:MAG: NAD(P)-binding domain-containing protein [Anaerolineales bacterium]|nr:NAD(P)-binding domain-containing protein [Anaerolineales bacterium]
MKVALLGLGEAGRAFAGDLVQEGLSVSAYDPQPVQTPARTRRAPSIPDAVKGADLVFSINLAAVSVEVARAAAAAAHPGQVYADLNTAAPETKRRVARVLPGEVLVADVALLAPVPGRGIRTPALASGPGAPAFAEIMTPFGMPVSVIGAEIGAASSRKLVRSVFMKGLAAAVLECLEAAERLDCEAWSREQIQAVLKDDGLLERLVSGSRAHAARRVHEMVAARELMVEVGVSPFIADAALQRLEALRDG